MTVDLKPCPFCGSPAKPGVMPVDDGGHFIACTNKACGASTNLRFACGDDPLPLQAEQWNRRTGAATPQAALDAVAYLVEGFDSNGKLYAKILHFTVTAARESAAVFAQHYSIVTTTALVRMHVTGGLVQIAKPQEWTDPEKEPRFQPGEET